MLRLYLIFLFILLPYKSYAETTLRMANWLPPTHPWVLNIMIPWIKNVMSPLKVELKSYY